MKKIALLALFISTISFVSCKKEKEEEPIDYDLLYLTKDKWKVSTSSFITDTTTLHIYTNGTPDNSFSKTETITISNDGKMFNESLLLEKEVGAADFYHKTTHLYNYGLTYEFNEDGNYVKKSTSQRYGTKVESTGVPAHVTPITENQVEFMETGAWSWIKNNDQKYTLTFDAGALKVELISNNQLTLKFNSSSTENTPISSTETKRTTTSKNINVLMIR